MFSDVITWHVNQFRRGSDDDLFGIVLNTYSFSKPAKTLPDIDKQEIIPRWSIALKSLLPYIKEWGCWVDEHNNVSFVHGLGLELIFCVLPLKSHDTYMWIGN